MFDKNKFAQIIKKIKDTYNSQEDFSKKSEIGRTYLSQYMNMKLDEPPKPIILQKLAKASHGITSYDELMQVCGYTQNSESNYIKAVLEFTDDKSKKIIADALESLLNESLSINDLETYLTSLNIQNQESIYRTILFIYNKLTAPLQFHNISTYTVDTKKLHKLLIDNIIFPNKMKANDIVGYYKCPVYGQIPAGEPNWAEQCLEGYLPIDPNLMDIVNPEECFFLRVKGESMNKIIKNGAFALIRRTDWVENGEIAVVLVNGFDATLKKFTKQGDLVILEPMSSDPSFTTQVYNKDTEIKIIGKYIGKMEINN